jgi:hypothetical protein
MNFTNGKSRTRSYEQLGFHTEALSADILRNNHFYNHASKIIYNQFKELAEDYKAGLIIVADYILFLRILKSFLELNPNFSSTELRKEEIMAAISEHCK